MSNYLHTLGENREFRWETSIATTHVSGTQVIKQLRNNKHSEISGTSYLIHCRIYQHESAPKTRESPRCTKFKWTRAQITTAPPSAPVKIGSAKHKRLLVAKASIIENCDIDLRDSEILKDTASVSVGSRSLLCHCMLGLSLRFRNIVIPDNFCVFTANVEIPPVDKTAEMQRASVVAASPLTGFVTVIIGTTMDPKANVRRLSDLNIADRIPISTLIQTWDVKTGSLTSKEQIGKILKILQADKNDFEFIADEPDSLYFSSGTTYSLWDLPIYPILTDVHQSVEVAMQIMSMFARQKIKRTNIENFCKDEFGHIESWGPRNGEIVQFISMADIMKQAILR
ncbi:hypothetical protein HK096_010367 [Nowakowskiella sp. JEL0078]|nr:hypothetical protein HK096_010367 [Nowakowskiella sp. JEL0078]